MKPIFKIFLILFIFAAILLAGFFYFFPKHFKDKKEPVVEINGGKFIVEIADDSRERSKGLSGRENLCDGCGMLFVFSQSGRYGFWMKDMKFPLDFIWIAGNKIIDIDENIPSDYSGILKPEVPVDKVLEVNAGACGKYKIETGDEVEIDLDLREGG